MLHNNRFLKIEYLLPLSCSIAFCFSLTIIDFRNSTPWDFIALIESLGFISFVSNYSSLFWQLLGTLIILILATIIFFVSFWLQKKLISLKIITPAVSFFLLGVLLALMFASTFFQPKISGYYKQGVNDGKIRERIYLFDFLQESIQQNKHFLEDIDSEIKIGDKNFRTLKVITINGVKTITIYNDN
jgi:hypothetical protein